MDNFQKKHLEKENLLIERIKNDLPHLRTLLNKFSGEDIPYRFLYQSFKVYRAQGLLEEAREAFMKIAGQDFDLDPWWLQIVSEALVGPFELSHNKVWLEKTRPQMEAYFHTKHLLELIVKYGEQKEKVSTETHSPRIISSGWANVLCLFGLR